MPHHAVLVFTARSPKQILEQGGSQAWVLDRNRAKGYEYLVCAQNTHTTWGDATEPHGTAFLVGRISDLVPAPDDQGRWLIRISEYARILNAPNVWQGWRNPVRYTTLEELGIDLGQLDFEPVPAVAGESIDRPTPPVARPAGTVRPLTIAEAKQGLAAQFGVGLDDIEIIIRG